MARSMYLFVAAVALATAPFVYAADAATDPACAAEETPHSEATSPAQPEAASSQDAVAVPSRVVTLKALFAAEAEEEVIEVTDGVAVGMGAREVVVARIDTDGRVAMSCVDSEKAARAFIDSPIEKVATKQAKEQ